MKGILFQPDMVRQIRAKKKRQTRRIMKVQQPTPAHKLSLCVSSTDRKAEGRNRWIIPDGSDGSEYFVCPYGGIGTILAVKEAAWVWCRDVVEGTTKTGRRKHNFIPVGHHVIYQADERERPTHRIDSDPDCGWRLKIGRYLPGSMSRIHLTLTSVRVERALDITEEDILAEGCTVDLVAKMTGVPWSDMPTLHDAWRVLWAHINGPGNPGCWVLQWD